MTRSSKPGYPGFFVSSLSQLPCPVDGAACPCLPPRFLCMSTSSLHRLDRNCESLTMVAWGVWLLPIHFLQEETEYLFIQPMAVQCFPLILYPRLPHTYMWWSLWVSVDSQSCGTSLSQLPQTWHASLFLYCLLLTAFQWLVVSREISLQSILFPWRENNVNMIRDKAIGREAAKKAPHAHAHMHFVFFQSLYFPRGCQLLGFFLTEH